MLKKWKKTIKLFATTIIVLIYVTIGLFNNETLKGEEKNKKLLSFDFESPAGTTERYPRTIRTVIGFSDEFRLRKELDDRIECDAVTYPDEGTNNGGPMWRHEENLGIRVFSAYYDRRQEPYHYVRIIGLVRRNSSFYCQIWYQNDETITYTTQKAIIREVWSVKWGPKNETCESDYPAVISCLAPPSEHQIIPSWVSFVDKSCSGSGNFIKIAHPTSSSQKKKFVICVKPMNLHQFKRKNVLEWLEINLRLGAEAFVFYGLNSAEAIFANRTNTDSLVWKAFRPPQSNSCALGSFEQSIWHKRKMEIIAYNDCLYSNLYHAKFVIPLDLDEIIVPKTGNNWFEALRSHFLNAKLSAETKNDWPGDIDNYASFSVRNAYFFPVYPKDAIIQGLKLPKRDQKVPRKLVRTPSEGRQPPMDSIFDRTWRSYRLSPETDSVKSFVQVAKTLSVFNHYAFHVLGDTRRQFVFPENVFLLNHYRNSCDPVLIDGCREFLNQVVYDNSLERFRKRGKRFF